MTLGELTAEALWDGIEFDPEARADNGAAAMLERAATKQAQIVGLYEQRDTGVFLDRRYEGRSKENTLGWRQVFATPDDVSNIFIGVGRVGELAAGNVERSKGRLSELTADEIFPAEWFDPAAGAANALCASISDDHLAGREYGGPRTRHLCNKLRWLRLNAASYSDGRQVLPSSEYWAAALDPTRDVSDFEYRGEALYLSAEFPPGQVLLGARVVDDAEQDVAIFDPEPLAALADTQLLVAERPYEGTYVAMCRAADNAAAWMEAADDKGQ